MRNFRFIAAVVIAAVAVVFTAFGQTPVTNSPTTTPSGTPTEVPPGLAPSPVTVISTTPMQTETVEINDLAAFPSAISRKSSAGPFILHLINRTHFAPPTLQWALGVGPAEQTTALASAVNLTAFAHLKRQLGVVNLPAGTYFLQNTAGKIFLTLTIQ